MPDNLPEALDHVLYEMEMLWVSIDAICRAAPNFRNMAIECFAIHGRNLNEFFSLPENEKKVRDSLLCRDFCKGWSYSYTFNKDFHTTASKRVAHLTSTRQAAGRKTVWEVRDFLDKLVPECHRFLKEILKDGSLMSFPDNHPRAIELLNVFESTNRVPLAGVGWQDSDSSKLAVPRSPMEMLTSSVHLKATGLPMTNHVNLDTSVITVPVRMPRVEFERPDKGDQS